jgi:hypothetical protein
MNRIARTPRSASATSARGRYAARDRRCRQEAAREGRPRRHSDAAARLPPGLIEESAGVAGAHVVVEESGAPVLLVVRLKMVADNAAG